MLLLEVDGDGLEAILSCLTTVDLVMAERVCTVMAGVVRRSARVWHMVALQHVECPRSMLVDPESKSDWRFWRGVCVALTQSTSGFDDLLGNGNGICTTANDPNYLLLTDENTYWTSTPIEAEDAMHARTQLTFHQLFTTEPTAEELEYLGCLVSEVRLTPYVRRGPSPNPHDGDTVVSPREVAVAFTCNGVTRQTPPRAVTHAAGEQVVASFDPPLLLSPGFAASHGQMTVTLIGAYSKESPTGAPSRYSVRLSRLRCLGRQIRCLDYGGGGSRTSGSDRGGVKSGGVKSGSDRGGGGCTVPTETAGVEAEALVVTPHYLPLGEHTGAHTQQGQRSEPHAWYGDEAAADEQSDEHRLMNILLMKKQEDEMDSEDDRHDGEMAAAEVEVTLPGYGTAWTASNAMLQPSFCSRIW